MRTTKTQRWLVPASSIVVSGLLLLGGNPLCEALCFNRGAIDHGQWWRVLTGNFMHLGLAHWLLNAFGLAIAAYISNWSTEEWLQRVTILCFGVGMGLYFFTPSVSNYAGLSGMLYGIFLLIFLSKLTQSAGRQALRMWLGVVYLIWRAIHGGSAAEERFLGIHVVYQAHLWGLATAFVFFLGEQIGLFLKTLRVFKNA